MSTILTLRAAPWVRSFARRLSTQTASQLPALAQRMYDLDGMCGGDSPHFKQPTGDIVDHRLPHPVWSKEELENVKQIHTPPANFTDKAAYYTVKALRSAYDIGTGYTLGFQNEACMLRRVIILETVAGVPGMVGAMVRHLKSLRRMERDYGWIHTLLEEAENERMHLMTAMLLRSPGWGIRSVVMAAQGVFLAWYSVMYALAPKYCHRFVGYLEEEAVKTYTHIVKLMDKGKLPAFNVPCPTAAGTYWRLPEGSTLRDVFLAMRADEGHHRDVNHIFAGMDKSDLNPFPPGY